jgi:acyl-[acyl-carrier-protein]-phospholipid O-acyltransferase/long-chain-fatty-acid--[acyl-carrier-protein] ligase
MARMDFSPEDKVLGALPMFHSFGLVLGTMLPLFYGIPAIYYPSPLHFRLVPEMVYDQNCTITFGTDAFLLRYGKFAHPYDFFKTRYVFAGGEKLRDETRELWMQKFGIRIIEGYGTTEASPLVSTNTLMHYAAGTVGRFVPGMEYRLEKVPGIKQGKRLFVKGPNVMLGYLKVDNPGVIVPPADGGEGWYDTGDLVEVDETTGTLSIIGRLKRFAKVAGEMISLTAIEAAIQDAWQDDRHAVVALPDAHKGEKLVWVTTSPTLKREDAVKLMKSKGCPALWVPTALVRMERLPTLATGKPDYVSLLKNELVLKA